MQSELSTDTGTRRLLQLGYRQTLQRPLRWTHNSCICLCIMSPLTAITGLYGQGLLYGGPAVLTWGWVLTGCFTMLVGLAMSELSSKFPVSGGLYFWSFMLAGQYGPCASWLVGWVNLLGQIAFVSGNTYTFVQFFAAGLFLYSSSPGVIGYYPSNGMGASSLCSHC
ncbi:TPA: hypothetical protein ACH3X2_003235 [Trebouxia sp. C0005]